MRRALAVVLSFSLLFQNLVMVMPVSAQVTASPSAPSGQRPLVDGTANGVPLVNIAPPSARGVSHNRYDQFNVDQRGLILNNSMKPSQTTLGGWVGGNMQLGSTPARVILNEVVGGNASQLRGYLEIAGQRAELVVANPNGLHCDGCGFLNASRVTLATGTPQMNGGSLDRLTPGQGALSIGQKGLDARTVEQLDLLSREIVVEGDVLAQDLAVIASSNQVLYGTLRILENTGESGTSGQKFALDVKALGGMYANQIQMIATDKGLGVNSAGTLAATKNDLEISANGDIRIHNTYAKEDTRLNGPGDVRITGTSKTDGRLVLDAKGQLINEGNLQAGVSELTVAGDFSNSGTISNSGDLIIRSGGSLSNRGNGAVLQAGDTLSLTAGGDVLNEGTLLGKNTTALTAGQGTSESRNLTNHGVVQGQDIRGYATGDFINTGTVSGINTLNLRSDGSFGNLDKAGQTDVAVLKAGETLSLRSGSDLTNQGVIESRATDITVGGGMDNSGVVSGTDHLLLYIEQGLANQSRVSDSLSDYTLRNEGADSASPVPTLQSDGLVQIETGDALSNDGTITAAEVSLAVGDALINSGTVAAEDVTLAVIDRVDNTATGVLRADRTVTLSTGQTLRNQGAIASGTDTFVTVAGTTTNSGQITTTGKLSLESGGTILNQGSGILHADQNLVLDTRGALTNQGSVVSGTDTFVTVAGATTNSGQMTATGNASLNSGGQIQNQKTGVIHADGNLSVTTQDGAVNQGRIAAADTVLSVQKDLVNSGLIAGTDALDVDVLGALNNGKDGLIRSEGNLSLTVGKGMVNQGTVSGKDTSLTVGETLNNTVTGLIDGLITQAKAKTVTNTGRVYGDDLTVLAQDIVNRDGGTVAARETLEIGAERLDNLEGSLITSLGDATFRGFASPTSALKRLTNGSSRIEAGKNLAIYATLLENRNDHLETYVVVDKPIYHEDILMGGGAHPSYTCGNLGNTSPAWCPGTSGEDYTIRTYLTTYSHTEVSRSEPGEILSGRDMVLRGNVRNTDSHIVAGKTLDASGAKIENIATKGINILTVSGGAETFTELVWGGFFGDELERTYRYLGGYAPAPEITYSDLHTPRYESKVANPGLGASPSPGGFVAAGGDILNALRQHVKTALDGLVMVVSTDPAFQIITRPVEIILPDTRLFTIKTDPVSPYLVETDPAFTNYRNFVSSDYFYQQLQLDPDRTLRRLGDGYYEQRLVQDQIRALTGQAFLGDHRDQEEQYRALMNAGVAFAEEFDLTPGVRLTAEQMAALTQDMVWLVAEEVTLPDGRVEKVLVPQVYVHQSRTELALSGDGTLLAGQTVRLTADESISNSGRIVGQDVALKAGTDIVVERGTVTGETTRLEAGRDVTVQSGQIDGRTTLDVAAGRDVTLITETVDSRNGDNTRATIGQTTTVSGGDVTVQAGRDVTVAGADIAATGDMSLAAGRDVSVTTVTDRSHEVMVSGDNHRYEDRTSHQGSTLVAGGNMSVAAGDAVTVTGSALASGQDTTLSGSSVTIAAAVDSTNRDQAHAVKGGYRAWTAHEESTVGGTIAAGGNLSVVATKDDVTLRGAQLTAEGDTTLAAAKDVTIAAIVTENSSTYNSQTKVPGVKRSDSSNTISQTANGSLVAGNNVTVTAGADSDVRLRGSTILALNDITLEGKNVLLEAEQEKNHHDEYHYKKETYAVFETKKNSVEMGFGVKSQEEKLKQNSTVNVTSMLMAGNNLTARAQKDIVGDAAQLYAGQDLSLLAGRDVLLQAATDHNDMSFEQKVKDAGIKLTLTKNITQTLQNVGNFPDKVTVGDGGGMAEMVSGVTAAFEFIGLVKSLLAPQIASAGLSISASSSQNSMSSSQDRPRTGTVSAGNNLIIQGGQDVLLEGTRVSAGQDATLSAGRDLNLVAAEGRNQSSKESHKTTAGISAGLGLGLTGLGGSIKGDVGYDQSTSSGRGTSYRNVDVTTGGNLNMVSGQDTTMSGAGAVVGGDLNMDVGRNLTVESRQNTNQQNSQSRNVGVSLGTEWLKDNTLASSFPLKPTGNLGFGTGMQDKQFTDDQTRLVAKGDVNIHTDKHTQLTGAVIASTDGNVALDTGSFAYKDVQDHQNSKNVKASIGGAIPAIGGGDKDGKDGKDDKNNAGGGPDKSELVGQGNTTSSGNKVETGVASPSFDAFTNDIGEFIAGSSLGLPKIGYDSTTKEGTSRATIAAPNGQVTITVRETPDQDLSGLNRDLSQAQTIDVDHTVKATVEWDKGMTFGLLGMVITMAKEAESGQKDSTAFDDYPKYFEDLIEKWGKASGQADDVADFLKAGTTPNPPLNGAHSEQKGASQ